MISIEFNQLTKENAENYLDKLSNAYYSGNPLVSDNEFDTLYESYMEKYPDSSYLDKVGTSSEVQKVKLPVYLGSLNKIKPDTREFEKFIQATDGVMISEKLDGISILIEKKNNKLRAFTRGNGLFGQDVTKYVKHLIPVSMNSNKEEDLLVRGELIMAKKHGNETINLRNMVSGLVNSKKNPRKDILEKIEFIAYSLPNSELTPDLQFKTLEQIGFSTPRFQMTKIPLKDRELFFSDFLKDWRQSSQYEIDGIVLSYPMSEKIITGKNPKFSKAFKTILQDQIGETEVISIDWNITKDNLLKPVVITKPISINNTTIQRVTAYNAEFLEKSGIGIGSRIQIIKSGDVIPKIHKVLDHRPMLWPSIKWEWDSTKKNIQVLDKSINKDKLLHHFVKTTGAKFISIKNCGKLVEYGIDTPEKLLDTEPDDLLNIPGFQETSSKKIIKSVREGVQQCDLATLIVATNCLGGSFSLSRINLCLESLGNDFLEMEIEVLKTKLLMIKGFSEKLINCLTTQIPVFLRYLEENYNIRQLYLDKKKIVKKIENSGEYCGVSFCFSGVRDKLLQEYLEYRGGEIKGKVTNCLDYLIVLNLEKKSTKIKIAQDNGYTKIVTLEEAKIKFLK